MSLKMQPVLEDFLSAFEALNARSLDLFIGFFAVGASYSDPVHSARGQDKIREIFTYRAERTQDAGCKVTDFAWGRKEGMVYIHWDIYKGKTLLTEGITELCFMPDGTILSYKEFWGKDHPLDQKAYRKVIF